MSDTGSERTPTCPHCGTSASDWEAERKIGCVHCLDALEDRIVPYLLRRGIYSPMIPRDWNLKDLLREAVETEDFEEAARLRDLLEGGGLD